MHWLVEERHEEGGWTTGGLDFRPGLEVMPSWLAACNWPRVLTPIHLT